MLAPSFFYFFFGQFVQVLSYLSVRTVHAGFPMEE
jgi:hypothetical protein